MNMRTIKEEKIRLKKEWDKGTVCGCCNQKVKLYKRPLGASMAYALILISKNTTEDYFHVENYLKKLNCPSSVRGDFAKLVYFGLLNKKVEDRKDGSNRNGYYKITDKGLRFIQGLVSVPSHVHIYNNNIYGYSEKRITIQQSLGKKFNYTELMNT